MNLLFQKHIWQFLAILTIEGFLSSDEPRLHSSSSSNPFWRWLPGCFWELREVSGSQIPNVQSEVRELKSTRWLPDDSWQVFRKRSRCCWAAQVFLECFQSPDYDKHHWPWQSILFLQHFFHFSCVRRPKTDTFQSLLDPLDLSLTIIGFRVLLTYFIF
jgi:hypothetical protein